MLAPQGPIFDELKMFFFLYKNNPIEGSKWNEKQLKIDHKMKQILLKILCYGYNIWIQMK